MLPYMPSPPTHICLENAIVKPLWVQRQTQERCSGAVTAINIHGWSAKMVWVTQESQAGSRRGRRTHPLLPLSLDDPGTKGAQRLLPPYSTWWLWGVAVQGAGYSINSSSSGRVPAPFPSTILPPPSLGLHLWGVATQGARHGWGKCWCQAVAPSSACSWP